MNDEEMDLIKEQNVLLKEILKWIRFLGSDKIQSILTQALNNNNLRLAYQLSDGFNTSTTISKATSFGQPRVSGLWKEWAVLGIGEILSASGGGRFKRSFDLKAMGIQFTDKQKINDTKKETVIESSESGQ